jgi:two-component system, NarL family, response regulator DevR
MTNDLDGTIRRQQMTRVFLLDDHEIVRRGVRELLEAEDDLEVVGEASNAAEALPRIAVTHPDVAILDLRLPDGDGIEVCRDIRSEAPNVACLMLTSFADDEAFLGAVIAGASGYVLKQIRGSDLVGSVRRVANGESILDPLLVALAKTRLGRDREDERLGRLSPQERRILDLIAEGKTNREIASTLYLAEKTVKNYVSNLLVKLGMKRRTEAAVFAVRATQREHPSFAGPEQRPPALRLSITDTDDEPYDTPTVV